MPPQERESWVLYETDAAAEDTLTFVAPSAQKRKLQIVWRNVAIFTYLHIAAVYGAYLFFTQAKWATCVFAFALYVFTGLGVTAGVHRLWSHKAYKARWPLRVVFTILSTAAFQDAVIDWARNHRTHHKYSETDADPHNATRGFFFSHIGWLLVRKLPQVTAKGQAIDMSDLWADPILRFQKKYYWSLMPLACFIIPSVTPMLWEESLLNGYFICAIFRYVCSLHATWLINSAAHMFGNKPYDKNIKPAENITVVITTLGEGFHNYHHTFPWDYKAAELGHYSLNFTTLFIDIMAKVGLAYDLKTVSRDLVEKRVKRTGDGSHEVWGWGDKDIHPEDKEATTVLNLNKSE